MPLATCPNHDALRDFRLGKLPADDAHQIAEHLDACQSCQANIETISDAADTLVHSLRQPPTIEFDAEPDLRKALAAVEALGTQQTASGDVHTRIDVEKLGVLRDYQLLEELGAGGMGTVYKARHARLKRIVALKVLPEDRTRDTRAVARFEREMEAVGKLEHPNIVRALDAGQHEGTHYLVMEYVDGMDLSHLVKRMVGHREQGTGHSPVGNALRGVPGENADLPLPPGEGRGEGRQSPGEGGSALEDGLPSPSRKKPDGLGRPSSVSPSARVSRIKIADACELARQAADGLQCAHQHGLVHRDIKPSNLMLTSAGQLKVLDLGLALLLAEQAVGEELTAASQMMGTADYCAPEQGGDSHTVDIRADIYSLGCTLYKLLAGHAPFGGDLYNTTMKKLMAHMTLPVQPIRELRGDVPEGLAQVLDRMLAKDPADRYSTPAEIVTAIAPFALGSDLKQLYAEASQPVEITVAPSAPTAETTPYLSSGLTGTHPQGTHPQGTGNREQGTGDSSVGNPLCGVPGEGGQNLPLPPGEGWGEGGVLPLPPGEGRGEGGSHRTTASHLCAAEATTETYIGRRPPRRGLLIAVAAAGLVLMAGIFIIIRNKDGKIIGKMEVPDDSTVEVEDASGKKLASTARPAKPPKATKQEEPKPTSSDDAPLITAFDRLQRSDISPYELSVAALSDDRPAPNELVAIFGDSRMKHWNWIYSVVLTSDDETIFSGAVDGVVRQWDRASGQQRNVWTFANPVVSLALSPDGMQLAVGKENEQFSLIDVPTGKTRSPVAAPQGWLLAWSPDGSLLASAEATSIGSVDLWDPQTARFLKHLGEHRSQVNLLAFDPLGKMLVSASYDGMIKVWDVGTYSERLSFKASDGLIHALSFDRDGRLLVAALGSQTLRWFDPLTGNSLGAIEMKHGATIVATGLAGDRLVAGANLIGIFERQSGKPFQEIWDGEQDTGMSGIATSRDGFNFVTGKPDGRLRIWRAESADQSFNPEAPPPTARAICVSPDGTKIVAANYGSTATIWDLSKGGKQRTFETAPDIRCIAYSPDGRTTATGHADPKPVRLWDAATGKPRGELQGNMDRISSLAFSTDGRRLAAGDASSLIKVWDVGTGKDTVTFKGDSHAMQLAFSSDGRMLAAACYNDAVKLWDAETGELRRAIPQRVTLHAVTFSLDGSDLIVADGENVTIYDSQTGEARRTLTHGARSFPYSIAVSPDGKTVATGAADGKVRLWDPDPPRGKSALKQTIEIGPPGGLVRQVHYTPDGRHLVTLNGNGTIYVLRLEEAPATALTASER